MAEVRFTIKGNIQETVFSPVQDGEEYFYDVKLRRNIKLPEREAA